MRGASAQHKTSGGTDQAKTQLHHRQKDVGTERKTKQKLLGKRSRAAEPEKNRAHVMIEIQPLSRATPLHSVALRAGMSKEQKTDEFLTTLLTTLIGAAAHG